MERYDQIVVGAGIGGMTLAALLGLAGRKVLLLEKGPRIGGSMLRFSRRGVPFDTGFHFTGGFAEGGVLTDMLSVLGIGEAIRPDPIRCAAENRYLFEQADCEYALPTELDDMKAALRNFFPGDARAMDDYFETVDRVGTNTASLNLRSITEQSRVLPEDQITLADALDGMTDNMHLKALLAAYATCYGVPASEMSFANHCRICHGLYHSASRVVGGGQVFIDALQGVLDRCGVEILCADWIVECADIRDRKIGRFVLASGREVMANEVAFTIHPRHVLETLPREHLHKAFVERVESFEPSIGFFCLYGAVRGADVAPFEAGLTSMFPMNTMRDLLRSGPAEERTAVIAKHRERAGAKEENVLTVLEVSTPADVAAWAETRTGHRPASYQAYKQQRCEHLVRRVLRAMPELTGKLQILDTASMLTFRDYLHTPCGCAYGVRQKIGQFNLFGRLPLRNAYAAGQSAALPGIVGSMLASFLLARSLIGRDCFGDFVGRQLDGGGAGGIS